MRGRRSGLRHQGEDLSGNAHKVYPRLEAQIDKQARGNA
jgi:hypothetical protein